jgi:hypothetical protein
MDTLELLSDIAQQVGPKERPLAYQDFLEETLRRSIKPKKAKAAILNSIETDPVYLKHFYRQKEDGCPHGHRIHP